MPYLRHQEVDIPAAPEDEVADMPSETTHEQRDRKVAKRAYHGRVRSGCITCRMRKVKCINHLDGAVNPQPDGKRTDAN